MTVYDEARTFAPLNAWDGAREGHLFRRGILSLLAIKDSDIRILNLEQCRDAVDRGLHTGGAFSATIPLVALYYGGFLECDVQQPTKYGQDLFVLSKGHAVATLASIYAELGYFDRSVLNNSRSYQSILNGHPGPILPGVHISTGPLGQGLSVAQGFAIAGRGVPRFDAYCMVGDGELQEGPVWEAVMYSAHKRLDNLCVLVDQNNGQLDVVDRMVYPLPTLGPVFRSFGWQVYDVQTNQYDGVYSALESFKYGPRNGQPTAIICHCAKGEGGFSRAINTHKAVIDDRLMEQELSLQRGLRKARVEEFTRLYSSLLSQGDGGAACEALLQAAARMHICIERSGKNGFSIGPRVGPLLTRRAPRRDKQIRYDEAALPRIDKSKEHSAAAIITGAMKVFARDSRVVSIDADLASTSGLEAGVAAVDQRRALNAGVAEANMMNMGEAFAVLGCNVWISTFCPFFDWKVMRRIAVGQQERLEAIQASEGWLSEGHGLDLTMLATAANFETRTNGATHMGNDDITVYEGVAHLKIIDCSCPQQLLSIMKWIMQGNRGLVYLRVMRAASAVLYNFDFEFEYSKGYVLQESPGDKAVLISSGRGVHEALAAAAECAAAGVPVTVVDMPSIDEELLLRLYDSGRHLFIAEQNNGHIWKAVRNTLFRHRSNIDAGRLVPINALDKNGRPQFIHSGTYNELLSAFGLSPSQLATAIRKEVTA
jgi:transketolase